MIRAVVLLILMAVQPAVSRAVEVAVNQGTPVERLDLAQVQPVYETALAFIIPRTLEPESTPQLTLWGLRGLTTLDPAFTVELRETTIRLNQGDQLAASFPAPADQSAAAWASVAANLAREAADRSELIRAAGSGGIVRSFFDELFNHLDPYSRYAPPGAAETDRQRRTGQAGLGITLVRRGSTVTVQAVLPGSPAEDRGINPGDRILAVDGRVVGREDAAAVARQVAGPEGSVVVLGWRGHDGRVRSEAIERVTVPPLTVTAQRIGEIALIRIDGFSVDTDAQFGDALAAVFDGHRVRGLIIDLRGNRGGLLRQAVETVGLIMVDGTVVNTAGRNPQSSRVWKGGAGPDLAQGRPIVVLVDGRSASAAEIMAAALEDSGRAVVVGSATLGKGLVQTIAQLPNGGELFVTWSRVLAPLGWPIQGLGVMPQVCTSTGEEALKAALRALQRGEQPMAAALARHNAARAPLPVAQAVDLRNACPAAEGRDADFETARFLLDNPAVYKAALARF